MIIGLLTGRGGNQNLPDKNVYPVCGRPLVWYPLQSGKRAKLLDDIYLTTEDRKIKEVAAALGVKIIDRPPQFARPDSQHDECMLHAVEELARQRIEVDILVVLMCNVGIQPEGKIDACVQALLDDPELDSAVTMRDWGDHHPTRAKRIGSDGLLEPVVPVSGNVTTTRQLLGDCYFMDHQVWALRVKRCFRPDGQPPWKFLGRKVKGIMNEDIVVDVHTLADIRYTEMWVSATTRRG